MPKPIMDLTGTVDVRAIAPDGSAVVLPARIVQSSQYFGKPLTGYVVTSRTGARVTASATHALLVDEYDNTTTPAACPVQHLPSTTCERCNPVAVRHVGE